MKSKKVLIPVILLVVLMIALGLFWAKQKSEEREVLVSQEVIPAKEEPKKVVSEGLVNGELKEEGRNFQLRLVAEVKADPRTVYDTLVDFEHLKELIPDCTKFEVVETEGNRTVVYQKRFILFMGKEMVLPVAPIDATPPGDVCLDDIGDYTKPISIKKPN